MSSRSRWSPRRWSPRRSRTWRACRSPCTRWPTPTRRSISRATWAPANSSSRVAPSSTSKSSWRGSSANSVEVITHPPKLALKEAVVSPAEGHHKHKKQSGGHGQYGEVYLRLKPTPRGEGFKFTDSISQGRIPQQYVPAIEKGIRKTIEKGVVAGYTVVDVEVEVYDGSYHDVDSGPASFE